MQVGPLPSLLLRADPRPRHLKVKVPRHLVIVKFFRDLRAHLRQVRVGLDIDLTATAGHVRAEDLQQAGAFDDVLAGVLDCRRMGANRGKPRTNVERAGERGSVSAASGIVAAAAPAVAAVHARARERTVRMRGCACARVRACARVSGASMRAAAG